MADIRLVWNPVLQCADWQVANGRLSAGADLETAILLALFTDRLAAPDFVPPDGTGNRRGWWGDSLSGKPIGSRLWQLERRKITNRGALEAEAKGMCDEALAPLVAQGIATSITVTATAKTAGPGSSGNLLVLELLVVQPSSAPASLSYTLQLRG